MNLVALVDAIGRLEDDGSVRILDVPTRHLSGFLAAGGSCSELANAPVSRVGSYSELRHETIVAPGATIWGIGLNYRSKLEATGRQIPERPAFFLKASAALAPPGEPIELPSCAPDCVDYEGEIAVVIGRPLREAKPEEAEAAVVGVVAANDVTARDVMAQTGNPSLAKSFPGFAQFGSVVADPAALGGFAAIELRTRLNGDIVQRDTGSGMLLSVGELVAMLSRYAALLPGDVVLTGTPAGTGEEQKSYLCPGDVVEVSIGSLPPLRSEFASCLAALIQP